MSKDKRSVHTDALDTLGKIIDDSCKRDAIHLAVEPVKAGEKLSPGQDITVRGGKAYSSGSKLYGIVDPFLKKDVKEGDMFWLIIYPRTIKSLRHVWEHPDFDSKDEEREQSIRNSENWLRKFCEETDCPPYYEVMAAALRNPDGDTIHISGEDASGDIPDEFWNHVENISGMKWPKRPQYFSCSC